MNDTYATRTLQGNRKRVPRAYVVGEKRYVDQPGKRNIRLFRARTRATTTTHYAQAGIKSKPPI